MDRVFKLKLFLLDQLNNLRTKSYTNLEEVLSQHDEEDNYNNMVGRKTLEQEEPCSMLGSNTGKITFDRFGQQTETPVSSKATQLARPALSETDIQKYISLVSRLLVLTTLLLSVKWWVSLKEEIWYIAMVVCPTDRSICR